MERKLTKTAEARYVGEMPKAGTVITDITRVFNMFNYYYGYSDAKQWWIEYLVSINHKNATLCKNVPDTKIPTTLGWISKLKLLDCQLPDSSNEWFRINCDKAFELAQGTSKPEEKKRERVKNEHVAIIARIEDEVDSFTKGGYKSAIKFKDLYTEYGVNASQMRLIVAYYGRLLEELDGITTDKDLKQAYSHLTKNQIKAFREFVSGIVGDASTGLENQKRARKPRTPKKVSNSKIVKSLKYLVHSNELNINSINPEKLIGCSVAWFYNQKTRQLFYLTAKAGEKLGVKGTTITGFDPEKSLSKKVRKPELDIPKIASAARKVTYQLFNGLSTKASNQEVGRISADCLILKVE